MAAKKTKIPDYGTTMRAGIEYYRTRVKNADGKMVELYALTKEELYQKEVALREETEDILFRRKNPTVAEYCEKWLKIRSATVSKATLEGYKSKVRNYIVKPLGDMYMADVTSDDIRVALVPVSKKSASVYNTVNMLFKCIFYNAERAQVIDYNPSAGIPAKSGIPGKGKTALTDEQVKTLLDAIRGKRPYVFIMIGLYAGLRREEILALQWDCVFLDNKVPYLSVRRAWREEHNRPVISTVLKTPAARRDIPIPECLVDCLHKAKEASVSEYVISDSEGQPLSDAQFQRLWKYVTVRSQKKRTYYKYVNGESIRYTVDPTVLGFQKNNHNIVFPLQNKL